MIYKYNIVLIKTICNLKILNIMTVCLDFVLNHSDGNNDLVMD